MTLSFHLEHTISSFCSHKTRSGCQMNIYTQDCTEIMDYAIKKEKNDTDLVKDHKTCFISLLPSVKIFSFF